MSGEGRLRILNIGRLAPAKGQLFLLEAFADLVATGRDAELVVGGAGPLQGALADRARRLGVEDRVSLLGGVSQDRIVDLYSGADVFCLPSFAEGVPVVLMEAMAMQLPVIATQVGGVTELVEHGVEGFVVRPGSLPALRTALVALADDPALRAQMGARGREKVAAEFDLRRSAAQLKAAFERVAG